MTAGTMRGLMHAIYDRITVAGPEIVGVRLTQAAYAHGLALALPEKGEMARPTGVGRSAAARAEANNGDRHGQGGRHAGGDRRRPQADAEGATRLPRRTPSTAQTPD